MPIQPRERALTLTEVLIVVAILVLLALVLPTYMARQMANAPRIHCVSNLRQIGLAFRIWSNDNNDQFPWMTSTNGGTAQFVDSTNVFLHFRAASNELSSPKILFCNSDWSRTRESDFGKLSNQNLSYFIGLDADESRAQTILSGDHTISTNGNLMPGIWQVSSGGPVTWAKGLHQDGTNRIGAGNISLSDGSVQQVTSGMLQLQLQKAGLATNRFAVP